MLFSTSYGLRNVDCAADGRTFHAYRGCQIENPDGGYRDPVDRTGWYAWVLAKDSADGWAMLGPHRSQNAIMKRVRSRRVGHPR